MSLFRDSMYLEIHELAAQGYSLQKIARQWEIPTALLKDWLQENESLNEAYQSGKQKRPHNILNRRMRKLPIKQKRLLKGILRHSGNISRACVDVGINRSHHNKWLDSSNRHDPDSYFAVFHEIQTLIADDLEQELIRRGKDGVPRMKFYKGTPVMVPTERHDPKAMKIKSEDGKIQYWKPYIEHEYSDNLLLAAVRKRDPDYRDTPAKVSQNVNTSTNIDLGSVLEEVEQDRQVTQMDIMKFADAIEEMQKQKGKKK